MSYEIELKLAVGDALTESENAIISANSELQAFAYDVDRINAAARTAQFVMMPPKCEPFPPRSRLGWRGVLVAGAVLAVLSLPIANIEWHRRATSTATPTDENRRHNSELPNLISGYVAVVKRQTTRPQFGWVEVAREVRYRNTSTFTIHEGAKVYRTECFWSANGAELRIRNQDGSDGGPYNPSPGSGPDVRDYPFAAATSKESAARYFFGDLAGTSSVIFSKNRSQKWRIQGEVVEVDVWECRSTSDPNHQIEIWTEGSSEIVRRVIWQTLGEQVGDRAGVFINSEFLEVTPMFRSGDMPVIDPGPN